MATLYLDASRLNLGSNVSTVDIFGEFSQPPWEHKIRCKKSNDNQLMFSVNLPIKFSQKFKFIIDEGRAYVVSDHYLQTSDDAGNVNNVFKFHARTVGANSEVKGSNYQVAQRYPKRPQKNNPRAYHSYYE